MADLLSGKVGASLVAAEAWSRASGVSEGVYELSKARKDTDAMQRAASYMSKSTDEAGNHAEKAVKALGEAKRKAAAEEQKEREKAAKDTNKTESERAGEKDSARNADTVEVSAAGTASTSDGVSQAKEVDSMTSSGQDANAETVGQGDLFFLGKNVDVKV